MCGGTAGASCGTLARRSPSRIKGRVTIMFSNPVERVSAHTTRSVNQQIQDEVAASVRWHAAHQSGKHDSSESTKVPDQQIPVEKSPELDDTEGHPT